MTGELISSREEKTIDCLERELREIPQQSGAEQYSLPLIDVVCTIGDITQLSPEQRILATHFAAELYEYLGYTVQNGGETLIQADLERALEDTQETDPRKKITHVLLTQLEEGRELPQAYVRMVPSNSDTDSKFDPASFPTGELYEDDIQFGFECDEDRQGITNSEALELSRLVSISAVHRLAKKWGREARQAEDSVSEERLNFLRKYLPNDALAKYGLISSLKKEQSTLARRTRRMKSQAGMMLLMLGMNEYLREHRPDVKEFIGNLDGQAAGAFLSCRGGIEVERGSGSVDWTSDDVAGCFEPYMRDHEGEVTPFHFDPRRAINDAGGIAGKLMRSTRSMLRKEVIEEHIIESP